MLPLSAPWLDSRESSRVKEALAGRLSGDGPFCKRVEGRLAELLGVPKVLLTTSCTHAMELALMALGVGRGHEVICPSFTFSSTANAILRVGAMPVFADIEAESLGLDPESVRGCITGRTAAILPVHYAGLAPDMEALMGLAMANRLRVVEDAAQGFMANYQDKYLGTLGDAGCFSFHETKNITSGEGGALVLRDPEAARLAEIIREKGTNRGAFLRGEVDKYTWVAEGSSYVMSDVLAAILDAQLDKLDEIQDRRLSIVNAYRMGLEDWARRRGVRMPAILYDRCDNDHCFYLIFQNERQRNEAIVFLRAKQIQAAFHFVPLHSSPFGYSLHWGETLPVTDQIASTLLRLPLHPGLLDDDVAYIIDTVCSL